MTYMGCFTYLWLALVLAGSASAQVSLGPASSLTLSGPSPASATNIIVSYNGALGNDTFFYWITAVHPGGQSGLTVSPAIRNVGTLSAGNTVVINWTAAAGATSYSILKTTAPSVPVGTCTCLLATGVTGTVTTDTGAALTAFTPAAIPAVTSLMQIDNQSEASPFISNVFGGTTFRLPLVSTFTSGFSAVFDARGNLVNGVGSGGAVGGVSGNVQFNNSGVFGGSNNLFWDIANSRLGVGTAAPGADLEVAQTVTAAGALQGLIYTGAVNTNQTLSTEIPSVTITTAGRQWATGALATQREVLITQPTYSFVGASTITDASTVGIAGAPVESTNATLTNTHGLLVQAGAVSAATNSYGATINAQTGASNNHAAAFLGGNVGVGTAAPAARLDVLEVTEQLRLSFDGSNSFSFTVDASGNTVMAGTGTTVALSDQVLLAAGADTTAGTVTFADSANVASATTTTLTAGNVFHITGTTTITTLDTCDAANNGRIVSLIFDGVLTFTDGNNLLIAGDFVTTADDAIMLTCDGTNWYENSRSVN